MTTADITLRISSDGTLSLRNWRNGAQCNPTERLDLRGLDGRVVRLFERWMTLRDRGWTEEEVRVFGELLHRRLFPRDCWGWVRRQASEFAVTRLMLAFPADDATSRFASVPWEYLCEPDRPGLTGFLVFQPRLVLSRVVPSGTLDRVERPVENVRILPVVGEASNERLGIVDHRDVVHAIKRLQQRDEFTVLDELVEPREQALAERVAQTRPHVVHFIGHGRFRDGRGAVAVANADGLWLDETRFARALCSDAWSPAIVVLHACEGGMIDYEYRFAGLAPAIVQHGALSVVAMQYAVRNSTATTFSTAMYSALADHKSLDESVQAARRELVDRASATRLVGIPMVYQRAAEPLLVAAREED